LVLRYPDLDATAREQVWINLLRKSGFDTTYFDTLELAQHALLNGREMKNSLRLAMAIVDDEGVEPLGHPLGNDQYSGWYQRTKHQEHEGDKAVSCLLL